MKERCEHKQQRHRRGNRARQRKTNVLHMDSVSVIAGDVWRRACALYGSLRCARNTPRPVRNAFATPAAARDAGYRELSSSRARGRGWEATLGITAGATKVRCAGGDATPLHRSDGDPPWVRTCGLVRRTRAFRQRERRRVRAGRATPNRHRPATRYRCWEGRFRRHRHPVFR